MKYGWMLGLALLAGLIFLPHYLDSCSGSPSELRFTTYHNPLPGEFAEGRVGVLRPHFRRRYLLLAYRELSGVPLTADELQAQADQTFGVDARRVQPWLEARKLVPRAPVVDRLDGDKRVPAQQYESYPNCLEDAFTSAAATLQKRVAQWGAESPQTAEWLRGQDQVFQNCSAGPAIPQVLPAADGLLSDDRNYQIAAAEFYAEQYDQARTDFDRVAATTSSPWHDTARYVAARVCIRQGTLKADPGKLVEAADRLEAIAKDPAAGPWQPRAQGLLGFVRAHSEPQQQLTALGEQLMRPGSRRQLERVLNDYSLIWDHLPAPDAYPKDSDVAEWMAVFQDGLPALDAWREKRTMPWLVAALRTAPAAAARELIDAARAVKPDSPAYDSVVYYGILTQIRAGELDAARAWTEGVMAGKPSAGTMNLLRSERLRLARDWTEFLRFAPRQPITDMSDDDDFDTPIEPDVIRKKPLALDADSVTALNHLVPLSLWDDATRNQLLPANLQADIAQAAWVRAVVLGEDEIARKLATRLLVLKPELASEMRTYLGEKDPAAARFTATFLMLRAPGMEPMLREGMGRETPVMKRDILRDNWWLLREPRSGEAPYPNHQSLFDLYPDGHLGPTTFLPAAQLSAGQRDFQQLTQRAANSVNYLCANAIEWARAHPQDPRVPQALYLAVEATHYGPSEKSSAYSRQAFDLLHQKYPASEWTRKTKYWY